MLIYDVVIAMEGDVYDYDELVVVMYLNEEAANEHLDYIDKSQFVVDGVKWDYSFIRTKPVYDKFIGE